jgi:hypothetical protein
MITPRRWLGRWLARYLSAPANAMPAGSTSKPEALAATLRKGDVLLVEGTSRISSAIKYITQSTWSHAALCFADPVGCNDPLATGVLVEADLNDGVRTVPLSEYCRFHTRICRPVGLSAEEIDAVCQYMLARYLIRTPPVPQDKRRRLLALGSGDPTRAICSSLIAQAFQAVHYPLLPHAVAPANGAPMSASQRELLHIRHHSLFAPRDFDISPYFRIVKPTLECGFDFRALNWVEPRV